MDLGEFELIARLATRLHGPPAAGAVGIGDDCAALPEGDGFLLLKCDAAFENHHFVRGLTPWPDVGWKVATANVSDIVTCGGSPVAALVSLGVPQQAAAAEFEAIYDGLDQAARAYGFQVLGGNVSAAEQIVVDVFMLGRSPRFIARKGAQPGDLLVLSGPVGDSAAGLEELRERGMSSLADPLVRRHLRPRARQDLVPALLASATAAIDVSDGLAAELHHLAERSAVRLAVERQRIPLSPELERWSRQRGRDAIDVALGSGE
ncbi:MAG TPA: thiamine-phosphate kinase, partial [bacterium]|nr:thiamine-phosphate kinase [bacterium]